jgi:hypothetical protein
MTAINSRNSFVGRGHKLTSFFDGDAADGPSANQKQNENGEFIIDGCQCSLRTEVLLRARLWAERPGLRRMPGGRFSSKRKSGGRVMRKFLVTLAVGATVAIGVVANPTPADARWRHHHHGFPVAPIVGGLAAGALIGAALAAPRPYYSYAYEPVYFGPTCRVRRESFWDGWRWRVRRVEDCY